MIKLSEFMNDSDEWHAFWTGFTEPFTMWWRQPIPFGYYRDVIAQEYHYYRLGKAAAASLIIGLGTAFVLSVRGTQSRGNLKGGTPQ